MVTRQGSASKTERRAVEIRRSALRRIRSLLGSVTD